MSKENIFSSATTEQPKKDENNQSTTEDKGASTRETEFLKVGERVFKDPQEVVTKIANQDTHIQTLEGELAELRSKLESANTVESLMEQIRASNNTTSMQKQTEFDPDTVRSMINETLTQKEIESKRTSNVLEADKAMKEHYGDANKAAEALKARAAELQMSVNDAMELAASNPNLFKVSFLNGQPQKSADSSASPTHGTINTVAQGANSAEPKEGTCSWYKLQMKKDPRNSFKYQNEIVKKAQEFGAAYLDT